MNFKDLMDVIDSVENSDLTEFSYEKGSFSLNLSGPSDFASPAMAASSKEGGEEATKAAPEENTEAEEELIKIYSPMIGTFLNEKADQTGPLVSTGDSVEEGQVICYIEAMQRKEEVRAPRAGVISSIHVANRESVEYGKKLYSLKVVGSHD